MLHASSGGGAPRPPPRGRAAPPPQKVWEEGPSPALNEAERAMRRRVVGLQAHRRAQAIHRVLIAAQSHQRRGEIELQARLARPGGHGASNQLGGDIVAAQLVRDEALQVVGVGMSRIGAQHALVDGARFLQPAGAVQLEALGEGQPDRIGRPSPACARPAALIVPHRTHSYAHTTRPERASLAKRQELENGGVRKSLGRTRRPKKCPIAARKRPFGGGILSAW